MVQRTVETIRKVNPEHWETERHVYLLDVNGQLVLAIEESGEATGR
jgi:hypothetical protein